MPGELQDLLLNIYHQEFWHLRRAHVHLHVVRVGVVIHWVHRPH